MELHNTDACSLFYFWYRKYFNNNYCLSNLLHVKRLACKTVSHPLCSSPLVPSFLAEGEKGNKIILGLCITLKAVKNSMKKETEKNEPSSSI